MSTYASFPSQSTQIIQDTEETDSKSDTTLIIDNNQNQNQNSQSSIHSKLERLNININGENMNGNTIINTNSNMSVSSHFLNNDKNNPQTLIKNNKDSNIVLMKLQQTLSPSTPKQRTTTTDTQSSFHPSNNRLKPSSAIKHKSNGNHKHKSNGGSSKDIELTYNGSHITFEPPSQCTNDPGAPIISLEKSKKEFKTVSQAAFR